MGIRGLSPLGALKQENVMLVGIGSKDFSGRRLLSHVGTWGTVPQLGLGAGKQPLSCSPCSCRPFRRGR